MTSSIDTVSIRDASTAAEGFPRPAAGGDGADAMEKPWWDLEPEEPAQEQPAEADPASGNGPQHAVHGKAESDAVKPAAGAPGTPKPDPLKGWHRPYPLDAQQQLPAFPVSILPDWIRCWVEAEAEATQTPPDLAAMLVLAIAGAGLARKHRVQIRKGWGEPTNVYTVTALPSGDRKSPVFGAAMEPVIDVELAEQKRLQPIIAQAASEHRVLDAQLKAAEKKLAEKGEGGEKVRELAARLAGHVVPESPRLFTDDVTPEKLSQMLTKHGGRMLVAGAEGTAFEIAKGRYSEHPNFDVYLKA